MHITCLLWTKANKTWTLAQARAKPNLAHSLLHPATIQYSGLSLSPLHCLFLGGFFFFFFKPWTCYIKCVRWHLRYNSTLTADCTADWLPSDCQGYRQCTIWNGNPCVHVHPTLGSKSLRGTSSSYFPSYQEQYKLIKMIITKAAWIYNCQKVPLTRQSIRHLSKEKKCDKVDWETNNLPQC